MYQLFKYNLIDTDTYVFVLSMVKEKYRQVQNKKNIYNNFNSPEFGGIKITKQKLNKNGLQ